MARTLQHIPRTRKFRAFPFLYWPIPLHHGLIPSAGLFCHNSGLEEALVPAICSRNKTSFTRINLPSALTCQTGTNPFRIVDSRPIVVLTGGEKGGALEM